MKTDLHVSDIGEGEPNRAWRSSQLTDVVHERSPPGRCSVACRSRWNQVEHRVAWFTSASASAEVYRLARRLSARAG
jgi:hypothetical protein